VALQEVEKVRSCRVRRCKAFSLSQYLLITPLSGPFSASVKDMVDLLQQLLHLWVSAGILGSVRILGVLPQCLQSVENTLMVNRSRKNPSYEG
jgi:hypothetical protein